jgi:copper resistance protein C
MQTDFRYLPMRAFHRSAAILLALLLAAWAVLLPAAPASAHDQLTGQNPVADATVAQMPEAITLTFSSNPVALGSQIQINDGGGNSWAEGSPEIVDTTASQAVRADAPAGTYTVAWRVVSSDGHPIEGTFNFTVSEGSAGASAGTAAPIETGTPDSAPESTSVQQDIPWSVIGMISVLVVLGVIIAVMAKRRLGRPGQ